MRALGCGEPLWILGLVSALISISLLIGLNRRASYGRNGSGIGNVEKKIRHFDFRLQVEGKLHSFVDHDIDEINSLSQPQSRQHSKSKG